VHPEHGEMRIRAYGQGWSAGAERGTVILHIKDPDAENPWATLEKPFGDVSVKPIGYFWQHTSTLQEISDEHFPPRAIHENST
jgi:hypothetical protein